MIGYWAAAFTDLFRKSEHRVPATSLCQDIPDEVFLAIVCSKDGNLLRWIALET